MNNSECSFNMSKLFMYLYVMNNELLSINFINFDYFFHVVCTEGLQKVRELIDMGTSFDHAKIGN